MNSNKMIPCLMLLGLIGLFQINAQTSKSGPPEPPLGKRWVLNPNFSDEFNGTELDTTKWFDHHPKWKGREPGIFMPSQVSVKDGYLQIKGEKMAKDTIVKAYGRDFIYNIAGGAVVSKKSAFLGYYECKVKAAATTMSTTFWFSTDGSFNGPNGCDKYGLEWDIHESIGRNGDFKGSYFANGMHCNSHYWYTDCDGVRHDHRAPQVKFEDDEVTSKDFHVYGGWWRDENTASYYYDDRTPKHQKFYDEVSKKPFDQPMYMRLVSETYPFPWIELPTDEELADPSKNVVYYDWVRGYKLVDIDDSNKTNNSEPVIDIYDENISFPKASITLNLSQGVKIPLSYQTNEDREINLKLFDSEGKKVADATFMAYAGYAHMAYELKTDEKLKANAIYKLTGNLLPINAEKGSSLDLSNLRIEFTEQ